MAAGPVTGASPGGGRKTCFGSQAMSGYMGAAFMLQDRYGSVGGEIKVAVGVGGVPGCLNPAKVNQNTESMRSAS